MSGLTRASIEGLLAGHAYEVLEHPVGTDSEAIAKLRGTPLTIGAKCLCFKSNKGFFVVAVQASEQVQGNHFRKQLGIRRLRFATRDELLELTGLTPGCVPPFTRPLIDLPLYADVGLLALDTIAFTAADPRCSIRLATDVWRQVAGPEPIEAFARS